MTPSVPIWIADSPDYTQGQESMGVDGDIRTHRQIDRDRVPADGGEQPEAKAAGAKARGDAAHGVHGVCMRETAAPDALRALRDRIEEVGRSKEPVPRVVLGHSSCGVSLRVGAVHEWIQLETDGAGTEGREPLAPVAPAKASLQPRAPGPSSPPSTPSPAPNPKLTSNPACVRDATRSRHWTPPLTLMAAVAFEAMRSGVATRLVWIGRRVFPYPVFLARQHPSCMGSSLFVDVRERDARVWAIDVALRSGVPACVIADGHGITLGESRRLQVAAKCGSGMALLARPSHEAHELSAAATRWAVSPRAMRPDATQRVSVDREAHAAKGLGEVRASDRDARVAWTLTLLRSKGESLGMDAGSLIAEWRDAQGLVVLSAMVADRTDRKAADAAS